MRRTTYCNYENTVTSRITPYLGDTCVQELRPRDVDMWLKWLVKAGLSQ
ncbi:hypothetical protein [Selenomonas noxia]|nr:hypothetical protein [Selenomonas noxia]